MGQQRAGEARRTEAKEAAAQGARETKQEGRAEDEEGKGRKAARRLRPQEEKVREVGTERSEVAGTSAEEQRQAQIGEVKGAYARRTVRQPERGGG